MELSKKRFEGIIDELKAAKGIRDDIDLDKDDMKELVARFKAFYRQEKGEEFPSDPKVQMVEAIKAVFRSWDNPRANYYRRMNDIPYSWGTAVNVMPMVFGNLNENSAPAWRLPGTPPRERRSFSANISSTPRAKTWWPASARPPRSTS